MRLVQACATLDCGVKVLSSPPDYFPPAAGFQMFYSSDTAAAAA